VAPSFTVGNDPSNPGDDNYYWFLNGQMVTDKSGKPIIAVGKNGKNGEDGQDGVNGHDGRTPKLKIENGMWYVSYDDGATWEPLVDPTTGQQMDFTSEWPEDMAALIDKWRKYLKVKE
jgi:hypothetical protein